LEQEADLSPVTARILYNRGIRNKEDVLRFMQASPEQMRSPFLFQDMEAAVERIHRAILNKEKILVYGDYDADGLTGTAVLVQFLRAAGAEPLFYVPDRLNEGYGFHAETVPVFSEQGVRLVITVDTGISAVESVRLANQSGMDVIITDHHECPSELPEALAILNPKASACGFPFRDLAGVGVAFYLVVALRKHLRDHGLWDKESQPNLFEYLDLVALGTLADMVPLQEENRIFVKHGMRVITEGKRPGIFVLKEQTRIEGPGAQTRPIVFRVIPRINAPGRLGCAGDALDILLCESLVQARKRAEILERLNLQRKSIENKVYREAMELANRQLKEGDRTTLVLASQGWHKGILGIVASRIAQQVLRPVVLVSFEGEMGKGSVRSVENLEIMDAMISCSSYLEDFGGHRMAAGLSIRKERFEDFQHAFESALAESIAQKERVTAGRTLDLWVEDPSELNERVTMEFQQMAPFGYGNDEPVLGLRNVTFLKKNIVGDKHLKVILGCASSRFDAIGFGLGKRGVMENRHDRWNVAITPRQDTWKGRKQNYLQIIDLQPAQAE